MKQILIAIILIVLSVLLFALMVYDKADSYLEQHPSYTLELKDGDYVCIKNKKGETYYRIEHNGHRWAKVNLSKG